MSSDDYQLNNIYRYSRKTYKRNRKSVQENACSPRENMNIEQNIAETSPRSDIRSDAFTMDSPGCSCDAEPDCEIANILCKKCPVITLAQQQLQRLLDETDKLLCDNTRCCRSVYDVLCICKEALLGQNKRLIVVIFLIGVAFFFGLILGAASCGTHLRRFDSFILKCIDTLFIPDTYPGLQDSFRCIA